MKSKYTKEEGYLESDLLHFGYDHIDTALFLINEKDPNRYDSAGYILHLGFELILKAWHLHAFSFFKDTHKLEDLINKLRQNGYKIEFKEREAKTIKIINKFYNLRYPRRVEGPIEIGADMFDDIQSILESLWQQLPKELIEVYNKIDPLRKGGRVLMEKRKT